MSFLSFWFLLFVVMVFIVCWISPQHYKWVVLLLFSYAYYMSWGAKYIVFILYSTLVSYVCALLMERYEEHKRECLLIGIIANAGVLFVFKYLGWLLESVQSALDAVGLHIEGPAISLIIPVGISFYTFQTIGYIIDVYKGKIRAEKHLGIYALFVSYFPQILSGPISRAGSLVPQLREEHKFDYEQGVSGIKLIATGLFKKMIIADSLALCVDAVFDGITGYQGLSLVVAAFAFSIEIYCDFSGYTDIAIGVSSLFGVKLPKNFDSPYFSTSVKEFWSRWHISLSTWFRDYVYIPLGGNRCSKLRTNFNLLITFLVSGLWHGANWTYLAWGGLHGLAQCAEKLLPKKKKQSRAAAFGAGIIVFIFVTLAWVLFRANSISDAIYLYTHAFDGISHFSSYITTCISEMDSVYSHRTDELAIMIAVCALAIYDYISRNRSAMSTDDNIKADKHKLCERMTLLYKKNIIIRWIVYILFVLFFLILLPSSSDNTFIYFQF